MKSIITAILIFAAITATSFFYNRSLRSITDTINENINEIETYFDTGDYKNAKKEFKKLKTNWENGEKLIQFETEHSELDIVNEQLSILSAHFQNDEYDEFYEALYKLKFFVNHIYEKKTLNTQTIF